MDIDKKVLPDPEQSDVAGDLTPKQDASAENIPAEAPVEKSKVSLDLEAELASLKTKNLELLKQKEHWREKYERDINKPVPSEEIEEDLMSDEGRTLKSQINALQNKLSSFEKEREEQRVYSAYPQLKDKKEEFEEYLSNPDNSGIKLERAAKLFLVENGLLETAPQRLGLEKPTSGSKIPKVNPTVDDFKRIRESQPRKYTEMLRKGILNPDTL